LELLPAVLEEDCDPLLLVTTLLSAVSAFVSTKLDASKLPAALVNSVGVAIVVDGCLVMEIAETAVDVEVGRSPLVDRTIWKEYGQPQ